MAAKAKAKAQSLDIGWRRVARGLLFSALLPITLFVSAGRIDWLMGWVYVALVLGVTFTIQIVVLRTSPDLIRERATSVERTDIPVWDRVLLPVLIGASPLGIWILAGLSQRCDWRFGLPLWAQLVAALVLVAGGAFAGWAMVVNRFFSAVIRIQHDRGHHVISSGPYRVVRHPGYAGGLWANLAAPLVLDAPWAFVPVAVAIVAMVIRTAIEDRTLQRELDGYAAYCERTRYRLIPGLW